jgi:hypothetical protein
VSAEKRINLSRIDIDAEQAETVRVETLDERQPNIAEPDYRNCRFATCDLVQQDTPFGNMPGRLCSSEQQMNSPQTSIPLVRAPRTEKRENRRIYQWSV